MTTSARPTWHQRHREEMTFGQRLADATARTIGSWYFIIGQTVVVALWVLLNITAWVQEWDPYPFILLNLMFSIQAAYAAPVIMMSQNRQAERDRIQAQADFDTNVKAEHEIGDLLARLGGIEQALGRIEGIVSSAAPSAGTSSGAAPPHGPGAPDGNTP